MAVSEKQLEANRRNAQQSTGPKTPEGKARSAQNARKHGLSASKLHIPEEHRAAFEELENSLRQELRPQGTLEQLLFRRLLHAAWCLQLIEHYELELLARQTNPFTDLQLAPALDRLQRYRNTHERSFRRYLHELRRQQTLRYQRQAFFREEAAGISILVPVLEMAHAEEVKLHRRHTSNEGILRQLRALAKILQSSSSPQPQASTAQNACKAFSKQCVDQSHSSTISSLMDKIP